MGVRPLSIVDFLKNNIYFVVIAVFFLFKLFGGSKTKPNTVTPKTQQQLDEETYEETYEEPRYTTYTEPVNEMPRVFKQQSFVEDRRATEPAATARTYQPSTQHTEKEPLEYDHDYIAGKSSNVRARLTKRDVRGAVLWAEIIGPPRAKKPYHRK